MDVVIDTNVIHKDPHLRSKNLGVLFDYLERTESGLVIPKIVIEELRGSFKRALEADLEKYQNSRAKLARTLGKNPEEIAPDYKIDIDEKLEAYIKKLKEGLQVDDSCVIPYKGEYLQELVSRATERKKPLDGKGQQFRDGILWLTTLDFAQSQKKTEGVVFISENSSDFANKEKTDLHADLKKEAEEKGVKIHYYTTVDEFVKAHANEVDSISDEWIEANVEMDVLKEEFDRVIADFDDAVCEGYEDGLEGGEKSTGYISATGSTNSSIVDHYVYKMKDGTETLILELNIEKEYEVEVSRSITPDDVHLKYSSGFSEWSDTEVSMEILYQEFRVKFYADMKDGEITGYEFSDWDWG